MEKEKDNGSINGQQIITTVLGPGQDVREAISLSQKIIQMSLINMENAEYLIGKSDRGSTGEVQAGYLYAVNAQNIILNELVKQTGRLADAVNAQTELQRERWERERLHI